MSRSLDQLPNNTEPTIADFVVGYSPGGVGFRTTIEKVRDAIGVAVDGSRIYNGSGIPGSGLGQPGDYYLHTPINDFYEKVNGTDWVFRANFGGAGASFDNPSAALYLQVAGTARVMKMMFREVDGRVRTDWEEVTS